jgi:uncharacterized integral membrane protein
VRRIIIITAGALFGIILLQNMRAVSFRILFWDISMPQVIFFSLILLVGLVSGFIAGKRF